MLTVHAKRNVKGRGIINSLINSVPEIHLGSLRYCGPGTKLIERIERGDKPVNKLDEACLQHDIAYYKNKDLETRHKADKVLVERAWDRYKAKDSSFLEKAASYIVTNAMKAKLALGAGNQKVKVTKKHSKKKKKTGKGVKKNTKLKGPRVIPLPKTGGILQYLFPILTGLTSVGSVAKTAHEMLQSLHNVKGSGIKRKMKLAPFKKGWGLYLRPYESKNC